MRTVRPFVVGAFAITILGVIAYGLFQKDSALAQWFRSRTEGVNGARKTKMIVALARKLLIALWRLVNEGVIPDGVVVRQG